MDRDLGERFLLAEDPRKFLRSLLVSEMRKRGTGEHSPPPYVIVSAKPARERIEGLIATRMLVTS
jgi:hypothetical protein